MAHYRRGRKVPALPPAYRHLIGGLTVVVVFAVVGLTVWQPLAAIPGLVVIAVLGVLDYMIVTSSTQEESLPSGPLPVEELDWDTGMMEAAPGIVDAPTQVLPRITFGYARRAEEGGAEPDPATVHTMAIDMRAYLDETGAFRLH